MLGLADWAEAWETERAVAEAAFRRKLRRDWAGVGVTPSG